MKRLLLGILCFSGAAFSQPVQQVLPNPDCQVFATLTAAGQNSQVLNNLQQGCTSWNFSYTVSGFSGVSVVLQSAANNAGVPASFSTGFPVQQTIISGSNPGTSTTAGFVWLQGTNAFARIHLTTGTGSGVVQAALFGWRIPNAASQGGGGGTIATTTNALKGDGAGNAVAVTGTGTNCVLVNGSSASCSSTTGNAASIVTYTPAASVTLTCPSATAGTVTEFTPAGGAALAANMALSFAACTAGQIVAINVIQAASGGPFTVSGTPTGSPQILTYPSSTTVYTLQAATATTMTFVNVAGISGSSSLGVGANGISRTVVTGTGVTVNLLASSDASNPTQYNTSGLSGCGSGVAAYSATAGNTFELYTVPGTVLTVVADGTITAGHLLTGGASTAGRVADTGVSQRTAVPLGTCIVGRALQSQTVGNTLLVVYDGASASGQGAASSVAWNAITNPTGNLSLTMGANTSTWTYSATTGSAVDLWTLTDTTSNTGTGYLINLKTASGSTLKPFHVGAVGGDSLAVDASGNVTVNTATAIGMFTVASTVNTTPRGIVSGQWSTDTASARFSGYKARGTQASPTVVVTGDFVSRWSGFAYDSANYLECASIVMSVQGTVAATRTAGQIDFSTCTDALPSVLTTAMTIDKSQNVSVARLINILASPFEIAGSGSGAGAIAILDASGSAVCWGSTCGNNKIQSSNGNANISSSSTVHLQISQVDVVSVQASQIVMAQNASFSKSIISGGTAFTATGCSVGTLVGGATAGTMVSGTTGACTVVITLPTAPTGWSCDASDRTTPANLVSQSASSTTSCTITGTTITNDVLSFHAIGY